MRPDRLERLTNLVIVLLNTDRAMPLREIGTVVSGYPSDPVALRQAFERDKKVLRENGIPILLERPKTSDDQVGYRIPPEHYYLPDLGLDAAEQLALGFALAAVRLEGGAVRDALSKLGSPDVPDLPPVAVLPSLPALAPLQEAVRRRSTARFHYRGREREVEPYGLCFRSGTWYIVGRDRTAGHWHEHHRGDHDRDHGAAGDDDHRRDVRTFRVDRIDGGVVATGEPATFEPPPDLDLAEMVRYVPWRSRGEEAIEVTVDVDPRELRSARNAGGRPRPKKNADGSTRHTFTVGDEGGFAAWAAGLGDGAVVVSPERIRKLVIDRLRLLAGEIDG